jgi:hypothetical protein
MQNSPRYALVSIPVKPYIKRFVTKLYGSPVQANNKSTLGILINLTLEKQTYEQAFSQSFTDRYYTDQLQISISAWQFTNKGFDIPPPKVKVINKIMEQRFEEAMLDFVSTRINQPGAERRRLIEAFAEHYGISLEEDISLDALVKTERRMRSAQEKAICRVPINKILFS